MQRPGTLASPGPAPAQLDAQLSLLREFLSAVYASMSLMRTRGQVTTYANLQKPVEHLCGKNFKVRCCSKLMSCGKLLHSAWFTMCTGSVRNQAQHGHGGGVQYNSCCPASLHPHNLTAKQRMSPRP